MKQVDSVGTHGATVGLFKRDGKLVLRWLDPLTHRRRTRQSAHRVLTKARVEALGIAQELQSVRALTEGRGGGQVVTWRGLLHWYAATVLPTMSPRQQDWDRRSARVWSQVVPLDAPVETLEPILLETFKVQRRLGQLPGFPRKVTERTVGNDLEWLRRLVNLGIRSPTLALERNPVTKVSIPHTPRPRRPVATWERYDQLRVVADQVGSQGLFGGLLDLVVALGWRVSALCQLHLEDLEWDARGGRIRKRAEYDKEGIDAWVPVSTWLAPRVRELWRRRELLAIESPWVFPQVHSPHLPWTKDYASARLKRATKLAGLEPLPGGQWHPFRRMWATLRKGLPLKDVAHAGAWKTLDMVQRYQQIDDTTVAAVMNAGFPLQKVTEKVTERSPIP